MMVKTKFGWQLMSLLLAGVAGCSWFSKPPSEPLADPHITLTLQASLDTNPNFYGRPSPVRVRVFQLTQRQTFEQASLPQLSTSAVQVLGGDLLRQELVELRPGERYRYHFMPDPRLRDIGVIAEYRDIDEARWRAVSSIDQSKTPEVFVSIGKDTVELTTSSFIEQ